MKVLIEVGRKTWARVREYATIRDINLGQAVDQLLQQSLPQLTWADRKVVRKLL